MEDLEKIREDSAESIVNPNNQLGMMLQNPHVSNFGGPAENGRQHKFMFEGPGVLSSIKTDLLPAA
jgi:hypothetical protein